MNSNVCFAADCNFSVVTATKAEYGNGNTSEKIYKIIEEFFTKEKVADSRNLRQKPFFDIIKM